MRAVVLLSGLMLVVSGCGTKSRTVAPAGSAPSRSVVTTGQKNQQATRGPAGGPRRLNGVPPGHYPKPGQCRLWVPGKPPGKQAPATACANLRGSIPAGAFILYGDRSYDADYDWAAQARRERGSVPQAILDILTGKR